MCLPLKKARGTEILSASLPALSLAASRVSWDERMSCVEGMNGESIFQEQLECGKEEEDSSSHETQKNLCWGGSANTTFKAGAT